MRTKSQWTGKLSPTAKVDGRSVTFQVVLDNDPTRSVIVKIPYSLIPRQMESIKKAVKRIEEGNKQYVRRAGIEES